MPKLPAHWVESHSGEPLLQHRPWSKCGICLGHIDEHQEIEWFNGQLCHESCAANEKET